MMNHFEVVDRICMFVIHVRTSHFMLSIRVNIYKNKPLVTQVSHSISEGSIIFRLNRSIRIRGWIYKICKIKQVFISEDSSFLDVVVSRVGRATIELTMTTTQLSAMYISY